MTTKVNGNIIVNNMPEYAKNTDCKFLVVNDIGGELWFYGIYRTKEQAMSVVDKYETAFLIELENE